MPRAAGIGLSHLRRFAAIARTGGVRRAAETLNVSQPALSRSLRELEERLGRRLFERHPDGLSLTAPGEAFLQSAERILALFEREIARLQGPGSDLRRPLRIAHLAGCHRAPVFVRRFRSEHPLTPVSLLQGPSSDQFGWLSGGSVDVALLRPPPTPPPGTSLAVIARDRLQLALPVSDPLARHASLSLEAVADRPFVLPPENKGSLHNLVMRLAAASGFTPRLRDTAIDMDAILGLVAAGAGVSVVPAFGRRRDAVATVPLIPPPDHDEADVTLALALAWRSNIDHPLGAAFRKIAAEPWVEA